MALSHEDPRKSILLGRIALNSRRDKLLFSVVIYALIELWRYHRFRKLLSRLRIRSYLHNGGRNFLAWAIGVLNAKQCPITIDVDVLRRYTIEGDTEAIGYGGGCLSWERFYSWFAWGAGRPFDVRDDPQLHSDLIECASACCRSTGIEGPPSDVKAQEKLALPVCGFGINDIRATFKPLPIRAFLRSMRLLTRLMFRSLGFRQISVAMPEGEMLCWTDLPSGAWSEKNNCQPPVVFVHGLGLGAMTFLSLFIGEGTKAWRSGGCVIVEILNLTFPSEELERLPRAMHCADAIGRLMQGLGYGEREFDIVCHSLSSFLVATMCNEGSPCFPRRAVLIDPVCFMEGLEVSCRFPAMTPSECRHFGETTVLLPKFTPLIFRRLFGCIFCHLICRDIFVQYLVTRWTGNDATSIIWRSSSIKALVCLSDEDTFVPSARVADHCNAHFPLLEVFRMPNADHGTFAIESAVRKRLLDRIALFLKGND